MALTHDEWDLLKDAQNWHKASQPPFAELLRRARDFADLRGPEGDFMTRLSHDLGVTDFQIEKWIRGMSTPDRATIDAALLFFRFYFLDFF